MLVNGILEKNESSKLNSYNKLIENSKDFILMENQFFITKSWIDEEEKNNDDKYYHTKIQNNLGYYLRKRIEKTYKNNAKFKVYIIINYYLLLNRRRCRKPRLNPPNSIPLKKSGLPISYFDIIIPPLTNISLFSNFELCI